MPEPRGQGAHTLRKPPDRKSIFGGWWTALDRWGEIPRGHALMVCGCVTFNLDNTECRPQLWVLPRHPWRGRPPVTSPTGKEGDIHPECGEPFERVRS